MPNYQWEVRTSSGSTESGRMSADTAGVAAMTLRRQGHHVLKLIPITEHRIEWKRIVEVLNAGTGPSQKEVLDFTVQLAVMVRAGINLRLALDGIAEQTKNTKFRRIIQTVRADVESGKSFSEAIARHPRLFNPLYVNMVKASEMSGSFAKMLDRIALFMQQQLETRKMVVGASIYPGIIAMMAIGVTVFFADFRVATLCRSVCGQRRDSSWPDESTVELVRLDGFELATSGRRCSGSHHRISVVAAYESRATLL